MTITAALALMTRLDIRRRGASLQCPHPKPPLGQPRAVVVLWDRDERLPVTGHPIYEPGFLCNGCAAVYQREVRAR